MNLANSDVCVWRVVSAESTSTQTDFSIESDRCMNKRKMSGVQV